MSDNIDFSAAADMLKELLSDESGKQQIQGLVSMLGGQREETQNNSASDGFNPENLEMMFKIQQIMSMMNSAENNKQTAFLEALKSMLSPDRHERIDRAVRIYGIGRAIEAFKKIGGV